MPVLGTEHSLVNPAHYPKLLIADVIGFTLQVAGLVVAFAGTSTQAAGLGPNAATGSLLVAIGLAVQLLSLSAFVVLFAVVLARASLAARDFGSTTFRVGRGDGGGGGGGGDNDGRRGVRGRGRGYVPLGPRFKAFIAMIVISLVCLLARYLYAGMAMLDGLGGDVAGDEALFAGFDGLMVAQAVVGVVAVHPACFLDQRKPEARRPAHALRWYGASGGRWRALRNNNDGNDDGDSRHPTRGERHSSAISLPRYA